MDLLNARKEAGFDRFDGAILTVYASILAWAIRHHLDWADEAQSWLIARDSSLHDLLFRRLHYEGAPALWPLLLWMIARLHLPYSSINWLSGCFALAGVFLLLRFSPFPRIFRWLLPFTFFLQYQYAVIARPYVLFPVLLFALCIVYSLARPRPILFAVIAGLIANVSAHGAVLAGIFCLVYLWDICIQRKATDPVSRGSIVRATAVFAALATLAIAVAFPAPDVGFPVRRTPSHGKMHDVLLKLVPEEHLPPSAPPLDPPLGDLSVPVVKTNQARPPKVLVLVIGNILHMLNAACYPVARSNLLATAFLISFALWLWSRECLRLAIPFCASVLSTIALWVDSHHTGLFLLAILSAVWIALGTSTYRRGPRWIEPLFASVALIVVLLQIGWTVHCVRTETTAPYDPGRATEEFLVKEFPGKRIAGFTFETLSAQPYAARNLFFNFEESYWVWSYNVLIDRRRTEVLAQHPDAVVVGDIITGNEVVFDQWMATLPADGHPNASMLAYWQAHGYRVTHTFCGERFIRLGVADTLCEDILEPVSPAR
jgi:hypothetical protein